MMRLMIRGGILIAVICCTAASAYADNKQVAKEVYAEGKRHFDLGDYPEALAAFKKAYLNYEEPVFLFNIALCYRNMGERVAAIRTFKAFLDNYPKAPNRASVERQIAKLESEEAGGAPTPAAPAKPTVATATPKPAPTAPKPGAEPAPSRAATTGPAPAATAPTTSPPAPTASAPAPATLPSAAAPKPATHKPERADITEMEEIAPNFDRPSNKPPSKLKWWGWTLIGVGLAGIAGATVGIVLSQQQSFSPTLPQFNVGGGAATTATLVRF
jgi:tetratricopeptide (TPR) repeat protein